MSQPIDVSLILTAHHEGMLAGVSAQSLTHACAKAEEQGLQCEILIVLDNADDLTKDTLHSAFGTRARYFETSLGDPGLARNYGISQAIGTYSTFLDGDDLWSRNWVIAAVTAARARPDAIFHSACNVFFGTTNGIWWHSDSEGALCDPGYLEWMNYWDALTLARTDIYKKYPFRKNDLKIGFGHEDWHWNIVTLGAGIAHKPVPETVHFKRRRDGSQSDLVDDIQGVPFPTPDVDLDRSAFKNLIKALRF